MKNTLTIIWFVLTLSVFKISMVNAQVIVDTIALPSGYTTYQLRNQNTLKVDPRYNDVWIGFRFIGAGKFNGNNWTIYDSTNSVLTSNNITAFTFATNEAWIGSTEGIASFDGGNWTLYNKFNSGFNADTVNCLEWRNGTLWAGTSHGLFSFNGANWIRYYSGNSILDNDGINSLSFSNGDTLWIGTNNGLYYHFGGIISFAGLAGSYTSSGFLSKVITDLSNTIWLDNNIYQGPSTDEPSFFLRNGSFNTTNQLFNSYCNAYPKDPNLMCRSGMGGMWIIDHLDNNPNYVYHVRADNASFTKYPNVHQGRRIFIPSKLMDHDTSNVIWAIDRNFWASYSHLERIQFEGMVAPDTSVPPCYQLDINNVRTRLWPNGSSHWDQVGNAAYEVPKGSGKNVIFSNGLWIGGKDGADNLHLAASKYRQNGSDFWPGPLDTITAAADSISQIQYDKIWKVNRSTIATFVNEFNLGNVNNGTYTIPTEIAEWPGNGSGNYSRKLAPYIDFNQDGVYNPFDGDRPDIKGDQFLWWVFNDNLHPHTETQGARLGLEIHGSAYAWNCSGLINNDSIINYTTFYQFKIINRSDTDYHSMYTGIMTDVDLGNYSDDFIGSYGEHNYAYAYNGDSIDESHRGYGENPPMINYVVLRGPLAIPLDGKDNDHNGLIDEAGENNGLTSFIDFENIFAGEPSLPPHYYNYMQSIWKDSTHLNYGFNGHQPTFPVDFLYTGIPYDTGWTEINLMFFPSDRRWVASSGPFDLPSKETRTLDFAYVYSRVPNAPNGLNTSIAQNNIDVASIQNMWQTQIFPCSNGVIGIDELKATNQLNLYPNPAKNHIIIHNPNKWSENANWKIVDISGRTVQTGVFKKVDENKIELKNLSHGIYFLDCSDKNGTYWGKFIVE